MMGGITPCPLPYMSSPIPHILPSLPYIPGRAKKTLGERENANFTMFRFLEGFQIFDFLIFRIFKFLLFFPYKNPIFGIPIKN